MRYGTCADFFARAANTSVKADKDLLMAELDVAENFFRISVEDKIRYGEISKDGLKNLLKESSKWKPEGVQIYHAHIIEKNLSELNDDFDNIIGE